MRENVQNLYALSKKKERRILGLMSGTSLDGLDLALCRFRGAGSKTKVEVEHFLSFPYDDAFKTAIKNIFAKRKIDFQELTLLHVEVALKHAQIIANTLASWQVSPSEIDAISSHGQTVFHAPKHFHRLEKRPNATFQIGDGDHLAVKTGILTISDFRQKHVAHGGEGAPLALYGDVLLFSKKNKNRFLLNLGGIANFTYLPSDGDTQKTISTDTGPANILMDAWAREAFEQAYDKDGLIAKNGIVQPQILDALKAHAFFEKEMPKSTGPELFSTHFLQNAINQMGKGRANPFDVMATLCQFTADTLAEAISKIELADSAFKSQIYLSGGGADNPILVKKIKRRLPSFNVFPLGKLGISAAAKEAVLFALLANETLAGKADEMPPLNGLPAFSMGKISFPK